MTRKQEAGIGIQGHLAPFIVIQLLHRISTFCIDHQPYRTQLVRGEAVFLPSFGRKLSADPR